jgi:hypothetical protein
MLSALIVGVSLIATTLAGEATALTLALLPSQQSAAIGTPFAVDVVASDLQGGIVSAYDLQIGYDPAVVEPRGASFGLALGDAGASQVFNSLDLGAPVKIAQLSLLSDAQLDALQGESFVLATLEFELLSGGASALDLVAPPGSVIGAQGGVLSPSVTDAAVQAVPEPTAALAFAAGAWLVASRARRLGRRC